MPSLDIKLDVDTNGGFDAINAVPLLDIEERIIHLGEEAYLEIGTLRHGMESGKDSMAFCFSLPDGKVVVAETSVELFVTAARAITAWQEGRKERGES
jgi:hypothetical protein